MANNASSRLAADNCEATFEAVAARHVAPDTIADWVDALVSKDVAGCKAVARIDNSTEHVALLFLLLARGVSPLLLPPESTEDESRAYAKKINAQFAIRLDGHKQFFIELINETYSFGNDTGFDSVGIYLLTSGSTGLPSIVFRSINSWREEARRYIDLLRLTTEHRVLLTSPIYHAYVLGWLWAVVESDCSLEIFRPTQLAPIVDALRLRATHCALTPLSASLLARRAGRGVRPTRLQVVMAGAGPVDAELEAQFQLAFGIGLSRNYGSTETGALLAGIAPLPPLTVGWAMPNVRVLPRPEQTDVCELFVELEDGLVYPTGDLFSRDEYGYRIIGRKTSAIRRGETWISPFEIESVLKRCPLVDDCQVRRVGSQRVTGDDHIIASVVQKDSMLWSEKALRQFCSERLRPSKVPDLFEQVETICRAANGKPTPSPVYQWAAPEQIIQAAGAYKQSMILFALMEVAGLERINGSASVDQIAFEAGLHPDSLRKLLDVATHLGLLQIAKIPNSAPLSAAAADIVALERDAMSAWNNTENLNIIIRQGHYARPFSKKSASSTYIQRYQRAMNGPHKQRGIQLALRKLRQIQPDAVCLLDISAASGAYSIQSLQQGLARSAQFVPVGGLNGDYATHDKVTLVEMDQVLGGDDLFDIIVLDQALHYHGVAKHLACLLERLKPRGTIIVDELFLRAGHGAAIGVDWITHGGTCHFTERDIDLLMVNRGFNKEEVVKVNMPVLQCINFYLRR